VRPHVLKGVSQPSRLYLRADCERFALWKPYINDYIRTNHQAESTEKLKLIVYNSLTCAYEDPNSAGEVITSIARASKLWQHRSEGYIFDHVLLEVNGEPGLAGVDAARLRILLSLHFVSGLQVDLACVQMCQHILGPTNFPIFAYTGECKVVPTYIIRRTVHMVPRWSKEVIDLVQENIYPLEIFDRYEELILNTHSDQACWNVYYE
jgi:hypothetical protein